MDRGRYGLLGAMFALAAIHASWYVIQGNINADHVQVSQGMGRLFLVLLLGAASFTHEGETWRAKREKAPRDRLIPALWLGTALLWALLAWPTLYRGWWGVDGYDYRTNRLTGTTEWRCDFHWKPVTNNTSPLPAPYRDYP